MRNSAKEFAQSWLGTYYEFFRDVFHAVVPFFSPANRLYWIYVIAFLVISFVFYVKDTEDGWDIAGYVDYVFPKSVYFDASALLTIRYFLINGVLLVCVRFSSLVLTTSQVSKWVDQTFTYFFGVQSTETIGALLIFVFGLLVAIARDFGDFIVHLAFHKFPVLWEFHKVHHCPTQITPFTNEQTHPIETIARGFTIALLTGSLIGVLNYLFLAPSQDFRIMDVGAIFFIFGLLANFRHSHIWLSFPSSLSLFFSALRCIKYITVRRLFIGIRILPSCFLFGIGYLERFIFLRSVKSSTSVSLVCPTASMILC